MDHKKLEWMWDRIQIPFVMTETGSANLETPSDWLFLIWQVVLKSEGKVHSLTVRDVQLNEAGQIKLTAKDFQTEANLIVRGKMMTSADSNDESTDL